MPEVRALIGTLRGVSSADPTLLAGVAYLEVRGPDADGVMALVLRLVVSVMLDEMSVVFHGIWLRVLCKFCLVVLKLVITVGMVGLPIRMV